MPQPRTVQLFWPQNYSAKKSVINMHQTEGLPIFRNKTTPKSGRSYAA